MIFFTVIALVTSITLLIGGSGNLTHSTVNYIVEVINTVYESIK